MLYTKDVRQVLTFFKPTYNKQTYSVDYNIQIIFYLFIYSLFNIAVRRLDGGMINPFYQTLTIVVLSVHFKMPKSSKVVDLHSQEWQPLKFPSFLECPDIF